MREDEFLIKLLPLDISTGMRYAAGDVGKSNEKSPICYWTMRKLVQIVGRFIHRCHFPLYA